MTATKTNKVRCFIDSESAMENLGKFLAKYVSGDMIIYLVGPLGVGKTTLTRGILRGLGYNGNVRSPTYTLIEQYSLVSSQFSVLNHFDLYRLNKLEELEHMGMRDYFIESALTIVEWPEKAIGYLPSATLECNISVDGAGRWVEFSSVVDKGMRVIFQIKQYIESCHEG